MPRFEMHILVNDQGQLEVNAPFQDRALCYGMLEHARDIIKDMCDKMEKGGVVFQAPPSDLPPELRPKLIREA